MKPKTTTTMTTAPRCDYSTARIVKKPEPVTFLLPLLLSTPDRPKYITRHAHKKKIRYGPEQHSLFCCLLVRTG